MRNRRMYLLLALILALTTAAIPGVLGEAGAAYPCVCISVRDYGDIYAELYPEYAPVTVENFLKLVGEGFYDGLTFHRIISGFMIQGGDPLGNGTGGSDQRIKGEFSQNGVDNPLKHERGVLSMARSSDMDSASSQFFVMHADASHLDGAYAAFGRVLCGMPAVDRICMMTPVQDNNGTVLKGDQPVIERIRTVAPEEAEAAVEAEKANGRAGSVYQDPFSPVSFPVPEGWNRVGYPGTGIAEFRPETDMEKNLTVFSADIWQMYADALEQQGYERETLNTDAMVQMGVIRTGSDPLPQEQHGGVAFYTAQTDTGTLWIGAKNGVLIQLAFSSDRDDPLFSGVEEILDQLTIE